MITRTLIRAKVVQLLYSHEVAKGSKTLAKTCDELKKSFDDSHLLYVALLQLIIDLTDYQAIQLDEAKHKYLPAPEDLNPDTRFVDNALAQELNRNEELRTLVEENKITWRDDELQLRLILSKVLASEPYKDYMAMGRTDFESDCQVWHQIMKQVILPDGDIEEIVENKSVFLGSEDLDVQGDFVLKTIRGIEQHKAEYLSKKFKDAEDEQFGPELLKLAVAELEANNNFVDHFVNTDRWDLDRLALMDRLIMSTALTEIKHFEGIPVKVSLNEYIELAKDYSTARSGQFVNGILNAAVNELRKNRELIKP